MIDDDDYGDYPNLEWNPKRMLAFALILAAMGIMLVRCAYQEAHADTDWELKPLEMPLEIDDLQMDDNGLLDVVGK